MCNIHEHRRCLQNERFVVLVPEIPGSPGTTPNDASRIHQQQTEPNVQASRRRNSKQTVAWLFGFYSLQFIGIGLIFEENYVG